MKIIRKICFIIVVVLFITNSVIPVFADKLSSINIQFNGPLPNAGDPVDDRLINISCGNAQILEYYWQNARHDPWEAGDVPEIHVTLTPYAGYFASSTKVYVSGYSAKLKSKRYESRDSLTCVIKLPAVKADGKDLSMPEDLFWESNNTARWNSVFNANSYDVRLLRNGNTVTTQHVSSVRYNFRSYMTREGDYTFRVRAKNGNKSSNWTDESDSIYVDEYQAKRNQGYDPTPDPSPIIPGPGPGAYTNYWRTDIYGQWHVYDRYNNMLSNCWFCDDLKTGLKNQWYVIDASGNLVTNGLLRSASGNFYSVETTPGENYGMIRNVSGVYNGIYIDIESNDMSRIGVIKNMDAINLLSQLFGVRDVSVIPTIYYYSSSF